MLSCLLHLVLAPQSFVDLSASLFLFPAFSQLFATGGQDGTVRLWHYTLPDPQASISQIAAGPSLTVQPMAVWSFGCPVTFMCNYTKQGSSAIIAGETCGDMGHGASTPGLAAHACFSAHIQVPVVSMLSC